MDAGEQAVSEQPKQEREPWVTPEVTRLRAGSAELGDVSNPDANVAS